MWNIIGDLCMGAGILQPEKGRCTNQTVQRPFVSYASFPICRSSNTVNGVIDDRIIKLGDFLVGNRISPVLIRGNLNGDRDRFPEG